mmetsp:Transcript_21639/g.51698  ORF Transcript_21639/g.51698 Transcript_21639/m.51698 type:complete len:257 (-) Transcript_21639:2077-2847(-)
MYCSWDRTTRHGLLRVSLVGSGSFLGGAFFSSSSASASSGPSSWPSGFCSSTSMAAASPAFFLFSASFFFRFAVVDSTAVGARVIVVAVAVDRGGGYAKRDGLALLVRSNLTICRSLFRPTSAVGWKLREMKYDSGYQYQYCMKTARPTADVILNCPLCERRLTVTFLPPASRIPVARMAPILHRVSSCLSLITLSRCRRNEETCSSGCCIWTRAIPSTAPCLTKSEASDSIGSSSATASRIPVPAQAIAMAMAAP